METPEKNKENVETVENIETVDTATNQKKEKKFDKPATSRTFLKFMIIFSFIMVVFVIFFVRSNNSSFAKKDADLQKGITRDSALIISQGNDLIRHDSLINVHGDSIEAFSLLLSDFDSRLKKLENRRSGSGNYVSKTDLNKSNSRISQLESDVSVLLVNNNSTTVVDNTTTTVVKKTGKKKNPCAGLSEEECEELMAQIEADAEDAAAQKEADAESKGEE